MPDFDVSDLTPAADGRRAVDLPDSDLDAAYHAYTVIVEDPSMWGFLRSFVGIFPTLWDFFKATDDTLRGISHSDPERLFSPLAPAVVSRYVDRLCDRYTSVPCASGGVFVFKTGGDIL